ncbi:UDP-N-acetylglucosamine transferase subunit ALG14 homolog [Amphibalanus amphitrite]|uniref:UDP-N-acetylglucosamine transferase subunit ALG14 homolog n=1 Tax=Amphibalanus amphitrite TaxID=1232801 RepID=UPI001C91382F|nr:UDP-N-acetylglucosamine transferase subunit ALG14 homolog [Amphibalanus amphitrite]
MPSGHTAEILSLAAALDRRRFRPRVYVAAAGDALSGERALRTEKEDAARLETIPRSRRVGQSWVSSVWTTAVALLAALRLVFTVRPRLVLANGPGTCVPVCLAALLMKWLLWRPVHVTFVESVCRVRSLSLSGQILYRLADDVIVQWPELLQRYPRALYMGRLV